MSKCTLLLVKDMAEEIDQTCTQCYRVLLNVCMIKSYIFYLVESHKQEPCIQSEILTIDYLDSQNFADKCFILIIKTIHTILWTMKCVLFKFKYFR